MQRHLISHETTARRIQGTIFKATWDTLGDATPGGELLGISDETIRGPHPSFDETTFCSVVQQMIG